MLTDKQIRGLKPAEKEYIVSDDDRSRGNGRLVLRVRPSGTKTWEYRYFVSGKRRKLSLGSYPEVSLAQARKDSERKAETRAAGQVGTRPGTEESPADTGSLGELLEAYVADLRRRNKGSADEVMDGFKRWIEKPQPLLWEKRADLVTPADIRDLLAFHIRRGVTTSTNRLRDYLHAAYQFGLSSEYNPVVAAERVWGLTVNPVAAVPRQSSFERAGQRVIDADWLAHAWTHLPQTPTVGWRFVQLIKLNIATGGQRPATLIRLRRQDVDLDTGLLDIPGSSMKTGLPHVVPILGLAREVVVGLVAQAAEDGHDLLFPAGHGRPGTMRLNSVSSALRDYRKHWGTEYWTLRDVRRTAKTVLGQLKVPKTDRDRLHGHAMTDVSSKHYDRYDYLDEKRSALAVWNEWLSATLDLQEPK